MFKSVFEATPCHTRIRCLKESLSVLWMPVNSLEGGDTTSFASSRPGVSNLFFGLAIEKTLLHRWGRGIIMLIIGRFFIEQ